MRSLEPLFRQVKQADGSWRSLIPDDQLAPLAPIVAGDSLDDLDDYVSLGVDHRTDNKGRPFSIEVRVPTGREPRKIYHDSLNVAYRVGQRAVKIIEHAQATHEKFIERRDVSRAELEELARCSIRLAKIDVVRRAARVAPTMLAEPELDDVQELIELLRVVPFDSLLQKGRLILNPTFGDASAMIGGADCDLLTGDLLIDLKTTAKDSIEVKSLDQILGYYLLARNERTRNPSFPEIKRLGLYYVRHGFLWVRPVSQWVDHPQFAEIEKWFIATALASQREPPETRRAARVSLRPIARATPSRLRESRQFFTLRIAIAAILSLILLWRWLR